MVYSVQQLIPVRTFQSSKCLGADGVVSPLSWGSGDHGATAAMPGVFRKNSNFAINLALGVQVDGFFRPQTDSAARGSSTPSRSTSLLLPQTGSWVQSLGERW